MIQYALTNIDRRWTSVKKARRQKNDNMKKICVYCERWASGGIESFVTSLLSRMDRSACQIDIVASCIEESVFTKPLQELGISFYQLSGSRNRVLENRARFVRLLREKHYDVLHVNAFHAGSFYFLRLGREAGIPVRIAHGHCAGLNRGKYYWLKMLIHNGAKAMFTRYATQLWACSQTAAACMYPKTEECRIIPNGIETERFRFQGETRLEVRKKLGLCDRLVVGTVGRLCREKNQRFLLDVFSEVQKLRPDSSLLLVGDGAERESLMQRVKQLHIEADTVFYGTTDHVEQLLWAMDLFVFPSLAEGLGLAAIEAQTAGLPVLCSDVIPAEAYLSPTMRSLPLTAPAARWASLLLDLERENAHREACADDTREKGFDIGEIAAYVAAVYQIDKEQRE